MMAERVGRCRGGTPPPDREPGAPQRFEHRGMGHHSSREVRLLADAIERIRSAEAQAEDRVTRARAEANQVIAEARQLYDRMLDEMRKEVREAERGLLEDARSSAEGEAEKVRSESGVAVDGVKKGAEDRVETAVAKVLDSISAAAR